MIRFEAKASPGQQNEVCDFAVQLHNSCSWAPVINSTHVVCAKCYKANIWVKPSRPDPAIGRVGKNLQFINPLPVSIDVRGGEKGNNFLFKTSMENDLHCIIQTAVKCIICTDYTVQYWVHFVLMHFISFPRRVRQSKRAWIMESRFCTYAKRITAPVHFTGDGEETHTHI